MKSDYDFKRVDAKKIGSLVDTPPKKIKKSKTDYDLVGQMPKRMQKPYFDAMVKNK